jgi:hypothetical protein
VAEGTAAQPAAQVVLEDGGNLRSRLVDHRAAADVDQPGVRAQRGQLALADEATRGLGQGQDDDQCCIASNETDRALTVRLLGLAALEISSFTTAVNGTGCTGSALFTGPPAPLCLVATGITAPVADKATHTLSACRP